VTEDPEKCRPDAGRKERKNGRFQPGQSGNPAGKRKGTRNRSTLVFEGLLDKAGPKILKKAIALAMGGDTQVLRALLPLLVLSSFLCRRSRAQRTP
jgi:hypothetical protein